MAAQPISRPIPRYNSILPQRGRGPSPDYLGSLGLSRSPGPFGPRDHAAELSDYNDGAAPLSPGASALLGNPGGSYEGYAAAGYHPGGMGGSFAGFANSLGEREMNRRRMQRLGLSGAMPTRPPASSGLSTNAEALLSGTTPHVTVGGAWGRTPPASGPIMSPEATALLGGIGFHNADGQRTFNDPSTLDARARQAALNLAAGSGGGLQMLQGGNATDAMHAAGLSPQAPAAGWMPWAIRGVPPSPGRFAGAAPELPAMPVPPSYRGPLSDAAGNPIPIRRPGVEPGMERDADGNFIPQRVDADGNAVDDDGELLPERVLPPSIPSYTGYRPPVSPVTPAPVLRGPMTPPDQVAANRARYLDALGLRQQNAQANGMDRGRDLAMRMAGRRSGSGYGAQVQQRMLYQAMANQLGLAVGDQSLRRELGMGDLDVKRRGIDAGERSAADHNRTLETVADKTGKWHTEAAKYQADAMYGKGQQAQFDKLQDDLMQVEATIKAAKEGKDFDLADRLTRHRDELQRRLYQTPGGSPSPGAATPSTVPTSLPNASSVEVDPRAEALLGDHRFKEYRRWANHYGGTSPDEAGMDAQGNRLPGTATLPSSGQGVGAALTDLSRSLGGAGRDPSRRAAVLASTLLSDMERYPKHTKAEIQAMVQALTGTGGMAPGFREYLTGPGFGDDEYEKPAAKFVKSLLAGNVPELTDEERRKIRKREGYHYLLGW